ncbi:HD-GYP domain-containing protein [Desulfitobacterium metallireducens]|uniref:Phosphohydrolase n=1 Tax=Desulfitobacterium metallireducens DSM 15288 TaxID=871968 RepID=W0EGB9_9FIRM|nr:HD-GYP domain-containing protein [Desulfitobacterium metallireducens]AHF08111.1 phosphohydrolase [Desulfitobacterium metallireducens DSM 15288]
MQFVLKPVYHRFEVGEFASQDYFDSRGALLLGKAQQVTPSLASFLNCQTVNTLHCECEFSNTIPSDLHASTLLRFPRTVPWLQRVYFETNLLKPELLFEAVHYVDQLVAHLSLHPFISSDLEFLQTSDKVTYKHSVNVALISYIIGKSMNFKGEKLRRLVLGALMHDIGKLEIPNEILNKPGALTEEEYEIMQTHPAKGVARSSDLLLPDSVLSAILQHHERWNGSGYPQGLVGQEILLSAQIMAVADVFDALITDRPYHAAIPPYHALEILLKSSGTEFSPEVLQALLCMIQLYPAGSVVTLNSGEVGIVLRFSYRNLTQPKIQVLSDAFGNPLETERIIDLSEDSSHYIQSFQHRRVG